MPRSRKRKQPRKNERRRALRAVQAAVTPLDVILIIAREARTNAARALLGAVRADLENGEDPVGWIGAVQVAHDTGVLTDASAAYLLELITEPAVADQIETDLVLVSLSAQMRAIERADGLEEEESYMMAEAPSEWLALDARWNARFTQMRGEMLERAGESRLSRIALLRPSEFDALAEQGWGELMPEDDTE